MNTPLHLVLIALAILAAVGGVRAAIAGSHMSNRMHNDEELIPDDVIQKCIESGDHAALWKAKHARQHLTQCGSALLHAEHLLPELRAAVVGGSRGLAPIVKKVCKSYQTSGRHCLSQYLDALMPCLNESQAELESLVVHMAETSWDYACAKDAERAQLFFKNSTLACLEQSSAGVVQCIAPYLGRLRGDGDPTRAVARALAAKECGLFLSVSGCVVSDLRRCGDGGVTAALVAAFFDETLRISPCADVSEGARDALRPVTLQSIMDAQALQMVFINHVRTMVRQMEAARHHAHYVELDDMGELKRALEEQGAAVRRLAAAVDAYSKRA